MSFLYPFSSLMPWVILYLSIGCIIGLFEYGITLHAFRNHPFRDAMSQQDLFLTCLLKNAIVWPVILFYLVMIGIFKVLTFFRGK